MSIYDLDLPTRLIIGLIVIIFALQGFKRYRRMTLVEFGKTGTHKLWKYVLTDWEGDTYECPKCGFETITNEGAEPAFNYCPMCGKKMCIDEEKEVARKEKKKTYMREYQQKRRAEMRGGNNDK